MKDAEGGGGLTAYEIYTQMNNGPGVKALHTPSDLSKEESQREVERAERIRRIADKIQAGWQGSAAEGAYGAAGPLAKAARDAADKQRISNSVLAEQSAAFEAARGNLRPVEPTPPQSNIFNDMIPWDTDLDKKIKKYQQDSQHNIDIYSRYDDQTLANERRFPQDYGTLADTGGDVSVKPAGAEPPPGGGGYPPVGPGPGGGGRPESVGGPAPQPVGAWQPPQGTQKQETTVPGLPPGERPPTRVPPIVPPGPAPGPIPGWPPVGPGPGPIGRREPGSGPVRGGDGAGRSGLRDGGPGGRGGADSGPGSRGGAADSGAGGRGGSDGGAGRGIGARSGPGAESGAGGRAGAGGLAAAEEAAARRGAMGGRGTAGAGGFGPMGAGRGPGGEDEEHERKSYLREPDPEAIFGTDEMTAPPVIGEE